MNIDQLPVVNERQRKGKADVPTFDEDVRTELRKLGEPVTYFGENKADRRGRLIELVSNPGAHSEAMELDNNSSEEDENDPEEEEDDDEVFYTPGGEAVLKVRKDLLAYSLLKAAARTNAERAHKKGQRQSFVQILKHRRNINSKLQEVELHGSQALPQTNRTLSKIRFSHYVGEGDEQRLAVGSWDGKLHILDFQDLLVLSSFFAHAEKVSALDWSRDNSRILSGGGDGSISIWEPNDASKAQKIDSAHAGYRITGTVYHPSGKYFASTSFDNTWKLWDAATLHEIYQQEGHSKEVFCGSFHPDGGLFASGGLDGIGRVWDLRSGRSIAVLQGHSKGIYSTCWSPNGYQLATASGDGSARIWDLRNPKLELFSIPAHTKLVSDIRFYQGSSDKICGYKTATDEYGSNPESLPTTGTFLVTSSYDNDISIWSADNWIQVKTLKGHSDKVMSCDISETGDIASCGWDRTVKVWRS